MHHAKYIIMILACGLLIPSSAHGYAENFDYAVQAKWTNNLNFMICLSSTQGKEYEDLFIKAVDEWKARWDNFAYRISKGSGCHINVHILKTHSMLAQHGYSGYTNIEYWEHGAITKADVLLPTVKKSIVTTVDNGKTVKTEIEEPLSKTHFYRAALHEFGHALNLGHFDDNGEEPIDIMYPYPADDDQEQGISQRDIAALNWLYLGFFEQEMTVRTDKSSYHAGDTVKILGKVSPVVVGKVVKLEVLSPSKQVHRTDTVNVSPSGTFSYKLELPRETESHSFKVKASYNNMIADATFEVKNSNKVSEITLVSGASQTNILPPKIEEVDVRETLIVDHMGSKLTSVQPLEQVFIRSSFSSNIAEGVETTYIVQIKSIEGYTVQISSATYNLANGFSTFSQSWLPDSPGKYSIQVFLWKSISAPEPLIPTPIVLDVTVA